MVCFSPGTVLHNRSELGIARCLRLPPMLLQLAKSENHVPPTFSVLFSLRKILVAWLTSST